MCPPGSGINAEEEESAALWGYKELVKF